MIKNNKSLARSVTELTNQEIQDIKNHLKKLVDNWIRNNPLGDKHGNYRKI